MKKFLNQLAILFEKIKRFFKKFGSVLSMMLGFNKNTKYVNKYIHDQNIRSGLFMGGIIVFLEIWLIIRQSKQFFDTTSVVHNFANYWNYIAMYVLFLLVGLTFALYSASKTYALKAKTKFLMTLIPGLATFFYSFYVFYPGNFVPWNGTLRYNVLNSFMIIIYASGGLMALVVALASVVPHIKNGSKLAFAKNVDENAISFIAVVLFALLCMAFGVRVSFNDHIRSFLLSGNPSKAHNEIICFLTMSIFVAALLVWRPWFSIVLHLGIFLGFYFLMKAADTANVASFEAANQGIYFSDQFTEGDSINYITFYVSLATVSVMIYHQRRHTAIKNETLFYIADYDALSGLHNFSFVAHIFSFAVSSIAFMLQPLFINIFIVSKETFLPLVLAVK